MVGSGDELGATSRHVMLAMSLKVGVKKRPHEECRRICVLQASERVEGTSRRWRCVRCHWLETVAGCYRRLEGEGAFPISATTIVPCDV